MLKVVIDINLFVSGVISKRGNPAKLLQLWRDRAFLVVISEQMVEEFGRVLRYSRIRNKYNLQDEEIEQTVGAIKKISVVVPDVIKLDVVKNDPDDNKVLACALAVKADYIISGDRHLLNLGVFKDIPAVTVKDFIDNIEPNTRG
ncbi:MAG: putative toxin-antitoxin system toxin component, PIN family [Candidatus Omnitrophica bacterium]|nr:putative toxin-antitoxin system toxin component, PIN family [Candidatus Omnitrophota bacterium]MBU0897234.1 putative toxin-antitoxin system toxin component, PIN family [Candidatus Omnitrophota bacterium]MBU1367811.1 putative toxin-antitoxin system toxin component, PIN family [Candidatus Omnitrophota bacterium]MBU1810083.1 putative toxin-antitoxin system toxin component, PIN family [Candidatus Omnitrophota bacterium]